MAAVFCTIVRADPLDGVDAELVSQAAEVNPGETVSLSVMVRSRASRPLELMDGLELPQGWASIVPTGFPFTLQPGEETLRLFSLRAPSSAGPGDYEIRFTLGRNGEQEVLHRATIVRVKATARIELLQEGAPPSWAIAGDGYEISLRAINRGNSRINVRVSGRAVPDAAVEVRPEEFALEPGEGRELTMVLETDPSLRRRQRQFVHVRAEAMDASGQTASHDWKMIGEVLPKVVDLDDPYLRLPSQLRILGAYSSRDGLGLQSEISGSGAVDEAGRHHLEFLARGPIAGKGAGPLLREEYRVRFDASNWGLRLGDDFYSLSPLTQQYRYGRGLGVWAKGGGWELGGFHLQSRWEEPEARESGAYLRRHLGEKATLGGNLFYRDRDAGLRHPAAQDTLYSVDGSLRHHDTGVVEVEYAVGDRSTSDRTGHALRAEARGRIGEEVHYSVGRTYAGPDFFGYYNDLDRFHGSIDFPILGRLRGNFFHHRFRNNLDRESSRGPHATAEQLHRGGVSYPFSQGTRVSIDVHTRKREDMLAPAEFHFREKAARLGIGHQFSHLTLQGYLERGVLDDFLRRETRPLERYSLYASYRPSSRQSYSVYARGGHATLTDEPRRAYEGGLSGRWTVAENLTMHARYGQSWQRRNNSSTTTQHAGAGTAYRLPVGHTVQVSGHWSQRLDVREDHFAVHASYSIPFGVPVRRKGGFGTFEGTVTDADAPGSPPLADIIVVANGTTAVTDSAGRFVFAALKPGLYTVRLEQASMGVRRTTVEALPLLVEIHEGETETRHIGVTTTAELRGRIAARTPSDVVDEQEHEDSISPSAVRGVLVRIERANEKRSAISDEKGEFAFQQLRPGSWTVVAWNGSLQGRHRLEPQRSTVELKSGDTRKMSIDIVPGRRGLRLIDEGTIE